MALGLIGEGPDLTNVDSDNNAASKACLRFFDVAIDALLREFDWGFARRYAAFNKQDDNPNINWSLSYRCPSDMLAFRYVMSGIRRPGPGEAVPYEYITDSNGGLILTDMPEMKGCYTARVSNTALFPPDFVTALSYYLAILILPRISAGDPYKRLPGLQQGYLFSLGRARANSANEAQMDPAPPSEFEASRG